MGEKYSRGLVRVVVDEVNPWDIRGCKEVAATAAALTTVIICQ